MSALDPWYRSLVWHELDVACQRLKAGPLSKMEWEMVKTGLLSALNTCDRALDYGWPGAGIDAMLSNDPPHIANCPYKNCRRCSLAELCPAYRPDKDRPINEEVNDGY